MKTSKAKKIAFDLFANGFSITLGLIICFPVIYCIFGSFKTSAEFASTKLLPNSFAYTKNFVDAFTQAPIFRYMVNSFVIAFFGSVIRLIISVLSAFAFTHYEFKFKRTLFFMILGTMMLPGDILLVTNYMTVSKLGLLNSYLGMCIVSFVNASQMFMMRQKFLSIPKDMRDASLIDGCGDIKYIRKVLLPICKPVLITLFVKSFIAMWNAYLWPLIVTASSPDMRTITVGITKLNSWEDTNYELVMAGVTLSLIPSFIIFFLMRRSMRKGGMDGALVG